MPLSTRLTLGLAGSVFALAMALATGPSAAQSRFNGQNDVPGAVIIEPDEQKINPDTIPEFPSTGDTSKRQRFYMSPSSRCTELEDPLPGGCEANTLQQDGSAADAIDGGILPFPLTLPPLPPVALAPLPKLTSSLHLPSFAAHPVLPPALALPLIVRPVSSLPAVHVVFPATRPGLPRLPQAVAINGHEPANTGRVHHVPRFHGLVSGPGRGAPGAFPGLNAPLVASVSPRPGLSVQMGPAPVSDLAFVKSGHEKLPNIGSLPKMNTQFHYVSDDIAKHGIAHPIRSSFAQPTAGYGASLYRAPKQPYTSFSVKNLTDTAQYPLTSGRTAATNAGIRPKIFVNTLVRKSKIIVGSSPYSHGVTVVNPTAFASP